MKKMSLEELQSYVVLRGSLLSSEDKKKVLIECDADGSGALTMAKVTQAIRMLGAGFFQEIVGQKKSKGKTYDATTLHAEGHCQGDQSGSVEEASVFEADYVQAMADDGDEDACYVLGYEAASMDALQEDPELAAAYTSYTDARRRLSEKFRNRGFWPVSQSAGKVKGYSNKGKSKGFGKNRKSLQQRIMESNCRLCGKHGHWKAERPDGGSSSAQHSRNNSVLS